MEFFNYYVIISLVFGWVALAILLYKTLTWEYTKEQKDKIITVGIIVITVMEFALIQLAMVFWK